MGEVVLRGAGFGALVTFVGFNALLYGLAHSGSLRHAIGFAGVVLLYPGDALGGPRGFGLAGNCAVWTGLAFGFLAWRERKQQHANYLKHQHSPPLS